MKNIFILVLAIFVSSANADVINAFTAQYDASNWTNTPAGGSVIFSEKVSVSPSPDIVLTQISDNTHPADFSDGVLANTDSIFNSAHADGIISFDWLYNTIDHPFNDYFGWLLGETEDALLFTQLSDRGDDASHEQKGSAEFEVKQGDIFGFRTVSTTSFNGSSTTDVYNFKFTASEVPEPSSMAFFALVCIFIGLNRRKLAK